MVRHYSPLGVIARVSCNNIHVSTVVGCLVKDKDYYCGDVVPIGLGTTRSFSNKGIQMFCFVPPQESVVVPQFYLNSIKWYLSSYKEAELLGWLSHDSFNYFTITSLSHGSVTPLIFLNRERDNDASSHLNKLTCESEWYNIKNSFKEKEKRKKFHYKELSQKETGELQKLQNIELIKLWEDQPYLIYMIGNDDGDKAKSFRSKEEACQWIEDVVKSGVCDSYSDFEILEEGLLYN